MFRKLSMLVFYLFTAGNLEVAISADSGSQVGNYYLHGYACNVVHNPDEQRVWAIHLYNFDQSLTDSEVVFGVAKNRKIQSVACTPNGSFMLFSIKETVAGDYEVYGMDLNTREITQLTDNDTDDVDVSLSADGLKMAWQEHLADGRQAILLRTYNESKEDFEHLSLSSASPFVQPSLSANGHWMAFVQIRKNNYLAVRYDLETGSYLTVRQIPSRNKLYHPSVSDDGLRFGWLQGRKQTSYIYKNLTGGGIEQALSNMQGIEHPMLSANGEWVIYGYNDQGKQNTKLTHLGNGQTVSIGSQLSLVPRYKAGFWLGSSERSQLSTGKVGLNDTGITQCADLDDAGLPCPVSDFPDQDAQHGRDVENNDYSDGVAGFSFTKIDTEGYDLPANAISWSCVKDNVTGLYWEVKHGGNGVYGDEGLHDSDDRFTWYTSDINQDGGLAGYGNTAGNVCYGYDALISSTCNTEDYVSRVNANGLCGASDWRIPTRDELRSIANYGAGLGAIDTNYFPNSGAWYWSSESDALHTGMATSITFSNGREGTASKRNAVHVRLVRDAE